VLGKAPVLEDGDAKLFESGAIVEYLISTYGAEKFKCPEAGKLDNLIFTHFAEGTLGPLLSTKYLFMLLPSRIPFFIRPVAKVICQAVQDRRLDPDLKACRQLIEDHLAKSPSGFFAGGENLTSADFMMLWPLEILESRLPAKAEDHVKTKEYITRITERPAFKASVEKGGKPTVNL